jgi:predicted acylesterase/phospholipase RssA
MSQPSKPARRRALGLMAGAAAFLRLGRVRAQERADAGAPADTRVNQTPQASAPRGIVGARPGPLDVVFEGGGMKGAAFAGAVEVLRARGFKLRRLIGSSAGAITAAFLAAGYETPELAAVLGERLPGSPRRRFSTFLEPPATSSPPSGVSSLAWSLFSLAVIKAVEAGGQLGLPFSKDVLTGYARRGLSLFATGSIADDGPFLAWMGQALERKGIAREATLGELQPRFAARGIQLSLAATDLTGQRLLVLNHHTAPQVPLLWAVRMSMGIPIVWPEVLWRERWGRYRGRPMVEGREGHHVVDGGVLSNFPLKYLLEPRHSTAAGVLGAPADDQPAAVLGVLLDESKGGRKAAASPAAKTPEKSPGPQLTDLPVMSNLSRLLGTMTGAWDLETIEEYGAEPLICRIPVQGFDTLDFDMDDASMAELVESGRGAMKRYLGVK